MQSIFGQKHYVKLSEETLQELSRKTLGSYIKQASADAAARYHNAGAKSGKVDDSTDKLGALTSNLKGMKRIVGVQKATDKLVKDKLREDVAVGEFKFKDGTKLTVTNEAAKVLNALFHSLDKNRQNEMKEHIEKSSKNFKAVLEFARASLQEDILTEANFGKHAPIKIANDNDDHAKKFAKEYHKGYIGNHREGGPTDADNKASEKFHNEYDVKNVKSGYAGSGVTHYTHKKTGKKFEVSRSPNGKGFYGTDHWVKTVNESIDLSELSKQTLKSYVDKVQKKIDYHDNEMHNHFHDADKADLNGKYRKSNRHWEKGAEHGAIADRKRAFRDHAAEKLHKDRG